MIRVLLADDSPHAQRMGERILSEEGCEVVTVSNGESAIVRLDDADPDVAIADALMPGRSGYEVCQYIKMSPRHKHVRVILVAGALEALDEAEARRVQADATLHKPFEATALIELVRRLATAAQEERGGVPPAVPTPPPPAPAVPFVTVLDAEKVRAAVTVALDASMGAMVEEITARVIAALSAKPELGPPSAPPPPQEAVLPVVAVPAIEEPPAEAFEEPAAQMEGILPPEPEPEWPPVPEPAPPPAAPPPGEVPVRPVRLRSSSRFSILGLDEGDEPRPGTRHSS